MFVLGIHLPPYHHVDHTVTAPQVLPRLTTSGSTSPPWPPATSSATGTPSARHSLTTTDAAVSFTNTASCCQPQTVLVGWMVAVGGSVLPCYAIIMSLLFYRYCRLLIMAFWGQLNKCNSDMEKHVTHVTLGRGNLSWKSFNVSFFHSQLKIMKLSLFYDFWIIMQDLIHVLTLSLMGGLEST